MGELVITIPDRANFYHLYADGGFLYKKYRAEKNETDFYYAPDARIFLFYKYPSHRRVYFIRNAGDGDVSLPGLSKKVAVIFKQTASRADKARRVMDYLATHYPSAFYFSDAFFNRLSLLISPKGKLNYAALFCLIENELGVKEKIKRRKSKRKENN